MATLIGPFSQVLPLSGLPDAGPIADEALVAIPDGGILVENGKISALGPYEDLRSAAQEFEKVDGAAVAIPGLVDAHTHICWAGSRANDYALRLGGATYQEIGAAGGGILSTVRHTRAATQEELTNRTVEHCFTHAARGVTTCEVKSGYGLTVDDELKMLRAVRAAQDLQPMDLVPTCLGAHLKPPEFSESKAYLQLLIDELLPQVQVEGLSERVDIFVEEGAFGIEESRAYLTQAKKMGFTLAIHADQFSTGGAKLAAEVGATTAEHLECSAEDDLSAMVQAGVTPVVLPGASLGLGMPFSPARAMLDRGLSLVIASDWNPGSAPNGDLVTQAAFLGAAQKLTMAETFAALTVRAARALGKQDRGTLEANKRADIAVFPTKDYRDILYYQGSLRPSTTYIAGRSVIPQPARSLS